MATPSQLIDADSAAELLGVPKTWILAQARGDRIPHVRLGRYVRLSRLNSNAGCENGVRGPPDVSRGRRRIAGAGANLRAAALGR